MKRCKSLSSIHFLLLSSVLGEKAEPVDFSYRSFKTWGSLLGYYISTYSTVMIPWVFAELVHPYLEILNVCIKSLVYASMSSYILLTVKRNVVKRNEGGRERRGGSAGRREGGSIPSAQTFCFLHFRGAGERGGERFVTRNGDRRPPAIHKYISAERKFFFKIICPYVIGPDVTVQRYSDTSDRYQ